MINLAGAVLRGFITGFCASIPLGPSGLESVNRSISKGFKAGFSVSVGAVLADVFYLTIINLGLGQLLNGNQIFQGVFWIASGLILLLFNHLSSKKDAKNNQNNQKHKSDKSGLVTGFFITFINPSTPTIWIALSATILNNWHSHGNLFFITAVVSMIIGSLSWFCLLNYLVCAGIKQVSEKHTEKTSKLLTIFLFLLGIAFIIYGILILTGILKVT